MITIEYLRSFHIGPYAIFDFVVSFLGVYLLSPILSKLFLKIGLKLSAHNLLLLTVPASILIHLLVGKITPMTRDFLNPDDHYLLKFLIIALIYFGIRDIKIIKKNNP